MAEYTRMHEKMYKLIQPRVVRDTRQLATIKKIKPNALMFPNFETATHPRNLYELLKQERRRGGLL